MKKVYGVMFAALWSVVWTGAVVAVADDEGPGVVVLDAGEPNLDVAQLAALRQRVEVLEQRLGAADAEHREPVGEQLERLDQGLIRLDERVRAAGMAAVQNTEQIAALRSAAQIATTRLDATERLLSTVIGCVGAGDARTREDLVAVLSVLISVKDMLLAAGNAGDVQLLGSVASLSANMAELVNNILAHHKVAEQINMGGGAAAVGEAADAPAQEPAREVAPKAKAPRSRVVAAFCCAYRHWRLLGISLSFALIGRWLYRAGVTMDDVRGVINGIGGAFGPFKRMFALLG
jgi:hypothetical protein